MRSADGQPVKHSESPWLFQTCMFSTYFTEQMPAIIREVNSLYDVDGFFTNGWPGTGRPPACRCEACRRLADRQTRGVCRAAPGAGPGSLEALGQHGQGEEAGQRVRGQPGRRHPRHHRSAAAFRCGGLVQCGPSGPQRRHADLGLRAAGARGAIGDEGALHHQCHRELRQFQAAVAAHGEGARRGHHVDGADHGERDGAVVSLAGRRAGGPAVARAGARVLPVDRRNTIRTSSIANRWLPWAWCSASA